MLDTHLLLWAAHRPGRLSEAARRRIADPGNALAFSTVSIWEVAIKASREGTREAFFADASLLRHGLLGQGYREIALEGDHAAAVADLPPIHKDPFDRVLVAQARVAGATLLTADAVVARYGEPVSLVA